MAEGKKTVGKIKKKVWYEILSPKLFRNASLGETLVTDKDKLVGKEVRASMANITGDMKRQSTIIKFKITELKGDKALTDIIGYSILLTHIKRMVRKGRERVDSSFVCKTKDDKIVRVKFILITRNSAKNSVLTSLRKVTEDILTNSIKKLTYSSLINDVIAYKLQRSLKEQLKKISPLKICEIRHISLTTGKKVTIKEAKETEVIEEEKKETEEEAKEKPEEKKEVSKEKTEEPKEKSEVKEDAKTDN